MPFETEQYFQDGHRWGVRITYSLQREYRGVVHALELIKAKLEEPFLCMPGNIVTNLNISKLIFFFVFRFQ